MDKLWNDVTRAWKITQVFPSGHFKVQPEVTTGPLASKNTFQTMDEAEDAVNDQMIFEMDAELEQRGEA